MSKRGKGCRRLEETSCRLWTSFLRYKRGPKWIICPMSKSALISMVSKRGRIAEDRRKYIRVLT